VAADQGLFFGCGLLHPGKEAAAGKVPAAGVACWNDLKTAGENRDL